MTKQYRLNYDWNGFAKGHVFERKEHREGIFEFCDVSMIDLLVLSGALTPLDYCIQCKTEHLYKCPASQVKKIEPISIKNRKSLEGITGTDGLFIRYIVEIADKVNEIINTKLK